MTKKHKYLTLDAIRGVAAIFVLIFHTGSYWGNLDFHHSYLAVDLFFVLSGFVIGYAYEEKMVSNKLTKKNFILTRLIRLYPMYFVSIIFASILIINHYINGNYNNMFGLPYLVSSIALTTLFLPSYLPSVIYLFPLNTPYWSIFYELVINIIYALIRPLLTNNILRLILLILGVLIVLLSYKHQGINAGITWRLTSISSGLIRSAFGILFGIYLFRFSTNKLFEHVKFSGWVLIVLVSTILMMPSLGRFDGVFDCLVLFTFFPAFVLIGTKCNSSLITSSVFSLLGRVSYPIYLLHVPIAGIIYIFIGKWVELYSPISGVLLVIFLIILSVLLENFVDIPARRYLAKRYIK